MLFIRKCYSTVSHIVHTCTCVFRACGPAKSKMFVYWQPLEAVMQRSFDLPLKIQTVLRTHLGQMFLFSISGLPYGT